LLLLLPGAALGLLCGLALYPVVAWAAARGQLGRHWTRTLARWPRLRGRLVISWATGGAILGVIAAIPSTEPIWPWLVALGSLGALATLDAITGAITDQTGGAAIAATLGALVLSPDVAVLSHILTAVGFVGVLVAIAGSVSWVMGRAAAGWGDAYALGVIGLVVPVTALPAFLLVAATMPIPFMGWRGIRRLRLIPWITFSGAIIWVVVRTGLLEGVI
jgi:hypothetical protein